MTDTPLVLTIGHSTRPVETFVELLWLHEVTLLADIRSYPRSRWNPQFNLQSLERWVPEAGVAYISLPDLGGKRQLPSASQSVNTGLKNEILRAFADYMQTAEFEAALEPLLGLLAEERVAIMCAEGNPTQCHRWILSDALVVRGYRVEHIVGPDERQLHTLPRIARVHGTNITYPGIP